MDPSKAVGFVQEPKRVRFNRRDTILYGLSIGIPEDDLQYLYELDPNFHPFPTYPMVLLSKGDTFDANDFIKESRMNSGEIPGIPRYDISQLVHGEQKTTILDKIPHEGEFWLKSTITGVYDKGSGMVIEITTRLSSARGSEGKDFMELRARMFVIGRGGWGGPKGGQDPNYQIPNRTPDATHTFQTEPNQALLYRLSGDFNPMHADPAIAPKVGFPKPILHGLCTYSASAYGIVKHMANNDSDCLRSIDARFAKPVFPGETLCVDMWDITTENAKERTILFIARVKERNAIVLSHGSAILKWRKTRP